MANVVLTMLSAESMALPVLQAAQHFSHLIGESNIIALMARKARPIGALATATLASDADADLRSSDELTVRAIEGIYSKWADEARQSGAVVQWATAGGSLTEDVAKRGSRADFIIIARPQASDDRVTARCFRTVLYKTGRPLVVVPPNSFRPFGRIVAVGWHDDLRTIKTIVESQQVIRSACVVHVFQCFRKASSRLMAPALFQDRGISVQMHAFSGDWLSGEALMDQVHAVNADFLMIGAYSTGFAREVMFGGATKYVLRNADLPVLMAYL